MLDPHFFLASVPQNRWRPCVLVVSQGPRTMGLLYCRERVLAGIGTRLAEGDDTLHSMIVASPLEKELVMRSGVEALRENMIGVRFLVTSDRLALLKGFRGARETWNSAAMAAPRTYNSPGTMMNFFERPVGRSATTFAAINGEANKQVTSLVRNWHFRISPRLRDIYCQTPPMPNLSGFWRHTWPWWKPCRHACWWDCVTVAANG